MREDAGRYLEGECLTPREPVSKVKEGRKKGRKKSSQVCKTRVVETLEQVIQGLMGHAFQRTWML